MLKNKVFKPFVHNQVIDCADVRERGDNVTHGDLLIVRCDESDLPTDFSSMSELDLGVLAEGEHTQHAHQLFTDELMPLVKESRPAFEVIKGENNEAISYDLRGTVGKEMFLVIKDQPLLLKHQEHRPMRLYPGYYHIGIQEETDHILEQRRSVVD